MSTYLTSLNTAKARELAARYALKIVEELEPKIIGLGTGRTTKKFIDLMINELDLSKYKFVISSIDTLLYLTRKARIVIDPNANPDIYIDSADEVDVRLNMIKGGGGALLREKVLSQRSAYNVFIVDYNKLSERIGSKSPVPIEVVPNALNNVLIELRRLGFKAKLRMSKTRMGPTITDNNNYIMDVYIPPIDDPEGLDLKLKKITGVVETGLFYNIIDVLIVGYPNNVIRIQGSRCH